MKSRESKALGAKELGLLILFTISIVCDLFSIAFLSYFDELVEIVFLCWLIVSTNKKNGIDLTLIALLGVVGGIGLLLSGYSRSVLYIIEDFLLIIKYPVYLLGIYRIVGNSTLSGRMLMIMYAEAIILLPVLFINCLYQYITVGGRISFLNTVYAGTTGFYAFLFSVIIYYWNITHKRGITFLMLVEIFMGVALCFLAQSTVSLVFCICFICYELYRKTGKNKIALYVCFTIAVVLISAFCAVKFKDYFLTSSAPRFRFYHGAWQLMKEYFPFGTGFSLFGGATAANYYSPLYEDLGWASVWEMRQGSPFLIDAYFPMLFGETGVLGIILYAILLVRIIKLFRANSANTLPYPTILIFLMLASGITSNFLNSTIGMAYSSVICAMYFYDREKCKLEMMEKSTLESGQKGIKKH